MDPHDKKHKDAIDADQSGEIDISGSTPDLESDDDTLETAHQAGLYEDATDEVPTAPVGVAKEVEDAEEEHLEED
jgi:hypothetical protein